MSKTKTTKRYWTPTIKKLVKDFQEWEERKSTLLRGIFSKILGQFDSNVTLWRRVIAVIAQIDGLQSLARASYLMAEPKVRPIFHNRDQAGAWVDIKELRHPCLSGPQLATFISNDVALGRHGEDDAKAKFLLLTGPNMGGKSTLLRQTCLAVILAQLGCYVPASQCHLSPVDRIFTRLGANDNIVGGQSTFMVELLDTAKILREATSNSLVILDELGRGTSTFDGMAIAHAVLLYLVRKTCCIGLFATHYRPLAMDFQNEFGVACKFMSCSLDVESRRVTFLYKLASGISPKSYGMNVAAMAGVPFTVIEEAERVADEFEKALSIFDSIEERRDQDPNSPKRTFYREILNHLCPRTLI